MYFVNIFLGMFTQYKNAGQLQVNSEVRLETFSTDVTNVTWKKGNVEMMIKSYNIIMPEIKGYLIIN